MAEFTIQKTIPMPLADTKAKITKLLDGAGDLKRYDSSLQINWTDQGAKITGKVFNGEVNLSEVNNQTLVNIKVNLAFLLTPLKGKVKSTIETEIDRMFGTTPNPTA